MAAITCCFGLLALLLACIGVYGVTAYSVASRRNEIGVRMALGARRRGVLGLVLGKALWIAAAGAGAGAGVAVAWILGQLVQSMLYGVRPGDPISLACGVTVLLAVALGASWLPAVRAALVPPMRILRHE